MALISDRTIVFQVFMHFMPCLAQELSFAAKDCVFASRLPVQIVGYNNFQTDSRFRVIDSYSAFLCDAELQQRNVAWVVNSRE